MNTKLDILKKFEERMDKRDEKLDKYWLTWSPPLLDKIQPRRETTIMITMITNPISLVPKPLTYDDIKGKSLEWDNKTRASSFLKLVSQLSSINVKVMDI